MDEARRGYRCIISAYKWSRYASLSTKFLLTVQVKSLPFCLFYKFLSSNLILKTCKGVQKHYTHIIEEKKKKKDAITSITLHIYTKTKNIQSTSTAMALHYMDLFIMVGQHKALLCSCQGFISGSCCSEQSPSQCVALGIPGEHHKTQTFSEVLKIAPILLRFLNGQIHCVR